MSTDQHDPGGKVRLALMPGVNGDATFSDDGRHRQLMRRWLGDESPERYILFVVANLARKLGVEPEDALRGANAKFVRRFGYIEAELARDGRTPDQSDLAEMDGLWDAAKVVERQDKSAA